MLKLTLAPRAAECKVELDGRDISRYLRRVDVRAEVGSLTVATLEYSGAVVVEGEAGEISLEQGPHYVECSKCGDTVKGESRQPIKKHFQPLDRLIVAVDKWDERAAEKRQQVDTRRESSEPEQSYQDDIVMAAFDLGRSFLPKKESA